MSVSPMVRQFLGVVTTLLFSLAAYTFWISNRTLLGGVLAGLAALRLLELIRTGRAMAQASREEREELALVERTRVEEPSGQTSSVVEPVSEDPGP